VVKGRGAGRGTKYGGGSRGDGLQKKDIKSCGSDTRGSKGKGGKGGKNLRGVMKRVKLALERGYNHELSEGENTFNPFGGGRGLP